LSESEEWFREAEVLEEVVCGFSSRSGPLCDFEDGLGWDSDLDVSYQLDEGAGFDGFVSSIFELGLHGLGASDGDRADLIEVLEDVVEGVEVLQESCSGLGSDSSDAGDVVAGVSDERHEVDDLIGPNPSPLDDTCGIDPFACSWDFLYDGRLAIAAVFDELVEVFVGGVHSAPEAELPSVCGECGHEVIGLESSDTEAGEAELYGDGPYDIELWSEVIRRPLSVSLVVCGDLVSERSVSGVKDERDAVRGLPGEDLLDSLCEEDDPSDLQAIGGLELVLGEVCTEEHGGAIDDE
jgi:hypothetical protein